MSRQMLWMHTCARIRTFGRLYSDTQQKDPFTQHLCHHAGTVTCTHVRTCMQNTHTYASASEIPKDTCHARTNGHTHTHTGTDADAHTSTNTDTQTQAHIDTQTHARTHAHLDNLRTHALPPRNLSAPRRITLHPCDLIEKVA
jgi:hypothetical protein